MTTIKDANGVSIEWNKDLKPRLKSGLIGQKTVNLQLTIAETKNLKEKIKSQATDSRPLSEDLTAFFGLPRQTAVAGNSDTKDRAKAWIKQIEQKLDGVYPHADELNQRLVLFCQKKKATPEEKKALIKHFLPSGVEKKEESEDLELFDF